MTDKSFIRKFDKSVIKNKDWRDEILHSIALPVLDF